MAMTLREAWKLSRMPPKKRPKKITPKSEMEDPLKPPRKRPKTTMR